MTRRIQSMPNRCGDHSWNDIRSVVVVFLFRSNDLRVKGIETGSPDDVSY